MATTSSSIRQRRAPKQDEQPAEDTSRQEQSAHQKLESLIPKPYRAWWNPNLPWLDLLICFLLSYLLPVRKITPYKPQSEEARTINKELRAKLDKATRAPFQHGCRQWSKACGGLLQCTWNVPRKPSLLYEWGIIHEHDKLMKQVMEKSRDEEEFVTVQVWCPASLVKKNETGQESECVEVESINLKDISHDVPMVVWFHGGGLTTGSSNFGWELKVNALLEKQKQVSGSECIPPLVVASVDYRLAPEHPLPAASIDALSVMDYCLKDDPERQIHVSGESAGGYLSLVSAFAGHKHYPGRVQSALVMIPFISPAADSMSYYMNGPSSLFAPASWARWCWRAALEMDDTVESEDDLLAVGSNRTAWDKSKWKQNEEWHKFLEPMEGVPSEMENGSKYIVAVNKADVVYDEGNELARRLKEHGADVEYLEASGSHGIGFYINRKAMAELIELWRAAIFDK